jgi:alkylresorcinol/alkylpyrone synthase
MGSRALLNESPSQARLPSRPHPRPLTRALLRAPSLGPVAVALADHRYDQREVDDVLKRRWKDHPRQIALLERFHASVQVAKRSLALPLDEYEALSDFGAANDAFLRVGTDLAARALTGAALSAKVELADIDAIFSTTVTGIAVPSIDARLVNRLGLRHDIRRTPMFGLGCAGGAAGIARARDYLLGHPGHVAVLVAVELCSLTLQDDVSAANLVASGLFGDAAAAVILAGRDRAPSLEGGLHGLASSPRRATSFQTRSG